jgi:hypothetical protein
MANAITTFNPVPTTKFIVNKYDDIQGGRVNQETPRGRLAFIDTNGRFSLPQSSGDAAVAAFVVDWPKPLNPAPYFDGPGLNGSPPYPFSDGSTDEAENTFKIDPDQAFQAPWPIAYKVYDVPPMVYGLPVTSGNKCLAFDGGTFTFGSGNYVGTLANYAYNAPIYAAYGAGDEGKVTYQSGGTTIFGRVFLKNVFGPDTLTVVMKGVDAL